MPLPTVQDAKAYLRVDLPIEDPLFTLLLGRAKGSIQTFIGYAITAVAVTHVDDDRRYPSSEIQLPGPFLSTGPAPIVTDVNGVLIDPTTYRLDGRHGKIRSKYGGYIFGAGAYTVVATIGLSAHPDYEASLEAVASAAILDLVAHLYENRQPVGAEGLLAETVNVAIPPRIQSALMALPCARGLIAA